jgi:hypothetical protein
MYFLVWSCVFSAVVLIYVLPAYLLLLLLRLLKLYRRQTAKLMKKIRFSSLSTTVYFSNKMYAIGNLVRQILL